MRFVSVLLLALLVGCGGSSEPVVVELELIAIAPGARAGEPASFELIVRLTDGSIATNFRGTVELSSSDDLAQFDATRRFTAADAGRAVLAPEFGTVGIQSLTVSRGDATASASVAVAHGSAASFRISVSDGQPSGKGQRMIETATVTAFDAFGNLATGFSAESDPVKFRVEGGVVNVDGLFGVDNDTLLAPSDFVDGVATLHGRAILLGVSSAAELIAESAAGAVGRSDPFAIDTTGPVPASSALLLDVNRNGVVDEGDEIQLEFDESVTATSATAGDIELSRLGDTLGLGATIVEGSGAALRIILGAGPALAPAGLASALSVASTLTITSTSTGAPVEPAAPSDIVPFLDRGQTFTTVTSLRGIAKGDFDGDGDLDLAVAAIGGGQARIFLNDGTGSFTQGQRFDVLGAAGRLAAGDVDGDDDVDLVFATPSGARVFLNDGAASFTETARATIPIGVQFSVTFANDITLGDLDNDGDLDMVLLGDSIDQVIYRNDGSGAFTFRDAIGSGYCERVALHDFNGDGFLDIVLATVVAGPNGVFEAAKDEVWRNDGSARFTKVASFGLVERTWGLAVGDLDGDGEADIVAGDQDDIRIYKNDGDGESFSLMATLDSRTFPFEIRLADLDGDGKLDILSMRGVWMNEGAGNFRFVAELKPVPRGRGSMVTGDFDDNGTLDVAVVNTRIEGSGSPSIVYFGATLQGD